MYRFMLLIFSMYLTFLQQSFAFNSKVEDSKSCNFLLKEMISRPKNLKKPEKFDVVLDTKKYKISYIFSEAGQSSSYVYLDNKKKHIVKFYQSGKVKGALDIESRMAPYKGQANYEYWVTRFYQSHSIPVVEILSSPQVLKHPVTGKKGSWVVKKYVEGIVIENGQKITPGTLNFFGYNSRKREVFEGTGETLEVIYNKLNKEMDRVRLLHTEENFRLYLESQGILDPDKLFKGFEKQWRTGDYFRNDNWLYTKDGWLLIDP